MEIREKKTLSSERCGSSLERSNPTSLKTEAYDYVTDEVVKSEVPIQSFVRDCTKSQYLNESRKKPKNEEWSARRMSRLKIKTPEPNTRKSRFQ